MNTLLVGYDLNRPGQTYSDLIGYMKGLGTWWHHLDSTWLVRTSLSASEARDDPELAARLSAGPGTRTVPPGRGALWMVLLAAVTVVTAPLLLGPTAFGVMAVLVLIGCPFAFSCWLPAPEPGPDDDLPY